MKTTEKDVIEWVSAQAKRLGLEHFSVSSYRKNRAELIGKRSIMDDAKFFDTMEDLERYLATRTPEAIKQEKIAKLKSELAELEKGGAS